MRQRDLDVRVECPTDDMTALPYEIVNSKMYDQLFEMIKEHRTTIVFTNTRSGTEHVVYKLKESGLGGHRGPPRLPGQGDPAGRRGAAEEGRS